MPPGQSKKKRPLPCFTSRLSVPLPAFKETLTFKFPFMTSSFLRRPGLWLALLPLACGRLGAQGVDIVPRPLHVETAADSFRLRSDMAITCDAPLAPQARYLQETLAGPTGWDLELRPSARRADIRIALADSATLPAEGYRLTVERRRVSIEAADAAGAFYGVQSLLQLFPPEVYDRVRRRGVSWAAPCVRISDAPNRPWRGMMLDVARYFFDKEFVKKYIDMMAMYKLNRLQLHMIDDSGWRLEIKKYPRLTQVGAWAGPDENRLGGYYTQDDMRELIAYARVRGVEIVPELEFPAHILSAIVAYPELGCTGEQHKVPVQHFISRDLLCVGKESSLRFLENVLDEVCALFPSPVIGIGGDEAVYTRWESCPRCRAVMEREGLTKASELQGWLTNVVARMAARRGRTVLGWEEIIQRGRVETPVTALIWHNVADTIQATRAGHKAVLTPCTHLYFDFPEGATPGEVKHATWMPPIPLEKTYGIEVNDYAPTSTVVGVQGSMWADQFIHGTTLQEIALIDENRSERYMEYFTFPRLLALAEVAWTPKALRSYPSFLSRLSRQYARLDAKGCGYRVPEPVIAATEPAGDSLRVTLAPAVAGAPIVYTTDGSYPTIHSARYTAPVTVARAADLRAMTVVSPRHYSLPTYTPPDYSAYAALGTFAAAWKPLDLQPGPATWRLDCSGKVTGNGTYDVTFVQTRGNRALRMGSLRLLKRDAVSAEAAPADNTGGHHTYTLTVTDFEAGTPYYIEVETDAGGTNDSAGLVFVRKH